MRTDLVLSVDLGQSKDYTAIVVLQARGEQRYHVPFMERPVLGTPYHTIQERIRSLWVKLERPQIVVDATGVGRPIAEQMAHEGLPIVPVIISGGYHAHQEDGLWKVPKRDLVLAAQQALQQRRVTVAASLPLAKQLVSELQNFRMKTAAVSGYDSFEAWREKDHDDLVLALAQAIWYADLQELSPDLNEEEAMEEEAMAALEIDEDSEMDLDLYG